MSEALAEAEVVRLAATLGIDLPPECLPGVVANLAVLAEHAVRLVDEA